MFKVVNKCEMLGTPCKFHGKREQTVEILQQLIVSMVLQIAQKKAKPRIRIDN